VAPSKPPTIIIARIFTITPQKGKAVAVLLVSFSPFLCAIGSAASPPAMRN
jgi:hypothetical protein